MSCSIYEKILKYEITTISRKISVSQILREISFLDMKDECLKIEIKTAILGHFQITKIDFTKKFQKCCGGAGYRSRYLSHAKRALYHLSYAPVLWVDQIFRNMYFCLKVFPVISSSISTFAILLNQ